MSSSASACWPALGAARRPAASRPRRAARAPSRRRASGSTRSATRSAKLLAISSRWPRPSIQAAFVVGKALRRGRPPQRLAEQCLTARSNAPGVGGAHAGRAQHRHHPLARPLDLGCAGVQASGAVTSAFAISFRSPSVSRKRLASRSTSARRRLVGDEMPRELGGDVLRGRRMAREIGEHRAALLDAVVGIGLADHRLRRPARACARLKMNSPPWSGLSRPG